MISLQLMKISKFFEVDANSPRPQKDRSSAFDNPTMKHTLFIKEVTLKITRQHIFIYLCKYFYDKTINL